MGHLDQRAGHLHAGRPGTDDGKAHPRGALLRVVAALGKFEGANDPRPDVEGVGERLQPRRDSGPVVVTEVAVRRARSEDQVVVADALAIVQGHAARGAVESDDFGLQNDEVAALHLAPQDVADRRRDRGRRQAGRSDLVQQRLEQMVVGAVDERDIDLGAREAAYRLQPAEAAADDQDARAAHPASSDASCACNLPRTSSMWLRSA